MRRRCDAYSTSVIFVQKRTFLTRNVRVPSDRAILSLNYLVVDRMPLPLGNFISRQVYDDKLFSKHPVSAMSCVAFVDARKGTELKTGFSWKVIYLKVLNQLSDY